MRKRIIAHFLLLLIGLVLAFGQGLRRVVYIYLGGGEYYSAVDGGGDEIKRKKTASPGNFERFTLVFLKKERDRDLYFIETYERYYLTLDTDGNMVAYEKEKNEAYLFYFEPSGGELCELKHNSINKFRNGARTAQQKEPFSQIGIVLEDVLDGVEMNSIVNVINSLNRDDLSYMWSDNRSYSYLTAGDAHNAGATTVSFHIDSDIGMLNKDAYNKFLFNKKPNWLNESKKIEPTPSDSNPSEKLPPRDIFYERRGYVWRRKACYKVRLLYLR